MPLYTVAEVIEESRALLNATAATNLFTETQLLPLFKKAYDELQDLLQLADIPVIWESVVPTNVPINGTTLTLPADFYSPIELHEKDVGQTDDNYSLMQRVMWLPDAISSNMLTWWEYREQAINFIPPLAARTVRLRYYKALPTIVDGTDDVEVNNAKTFLAARTAALAAFTIGEDNERASALQEDANAALDRIERLSVKNSQELRARRRPFMVPRGIW